MAKTKLKSYLASISGKADGLVHYTIGRKTYARRYAIPRNPRSEAQQSNRSLFAEAMAVWKTLSEKDKQQYRKKAIKLSMHGHNLFISQYIKLHNNEKAAVIITGQFAEQASQQSTYSDIIQHHTHPEVSPYQLRIHYNSASVLNIYPLYSVPV